MSKKKTAELMHSMRRNLASGVHTKNPCECGIYKCTSLKKCVCCQAEELRPLMEKRNSNGK